MSNDSRYRRLYGLSESEYDAQCEFQQDRCAVCGEQNPLRYDGSRLRLAVDHDHATNETRELLCDRCNKVLGFVRDSCGLLKKMIAYLKRHRGTVKDAFLTTAGARPEEATIESNVALQPPEAR